jgi:hypothetical protein
MQNIPRFMPREPTFLRIEVTSNDEDDTFETKLYCSKVDCRRIVDVASDGPKALQSVSCSKHGFLTSFPHQNALGEFIKFLANRILAANGHKLIETDAVSVFEDTEPQRARSVN